MDSDLEAFSHNPADGSFAALPCQTAAKTNYPNQRFLSLFNAGGGAGRVTYSDQGENYGSDPSLPTRRVNRDCHQRATLGSTLMTSKSRCSVFVKFVCSVCSLKEIQGG